MKYIASCSFGKDSLASVILAHEHNEPLDAILYSEVMYDIKNNISGEFPEHKEFIYNLAIPIIESWGYKVKIVKSDKDYKWNFSKIVTRSKVPERVGMKRGFPMRGKCNINRDCKIPPIKKYYREQGIDSMTEYVGIAIDETKRIERLKGTNRISLLEKYGYTEEMAKEKCLEYGLLSPIYKFAKRNGCWFCPNCNEEEFRHMKNQHPKLWYDLVDLGNEKNIIGYQFSRCETIQEIERRL